MSTKVDKHNKHDVQVSTKVDRYHIIKFGFMPCPLRLSIIILNVYSARKEGKTEAQENDFAAKPSSAAMHNCAFLSVKSFSNAGVFS